MALEYSVGFNQLIFLVNLPASTQILVSQLLSPQQHSELQDHRVLDGYIYGTSDFYIAHKIDGDEEPFSSHSYAYFPFVDWHKKVYIRSPTAQVLRLKFILDF